MLKKIIFFTLLSFSFFLNAENDIEVKTKDGWKENFQSINVKQPKNKSIFSDKEYLEAVKYKEELMKKITPEQLAIAKKIILLEFYVF